jgi:hypothetical protein
MGKFWQDARFRSGWSCINALEAKTPSPLLVRATWSARPFHRPSTFDGMPEHRECRNKGEVRVRSSP